MSDIELYTARLILRRFTQSDARACYAGFGGDESLHRYLPMYPVADEAAMAAQLAGFEAAYSGGALIWAVEERGTGKIAGMVNLEIAYPGLGTAELAYLLGKNFRGQGYAAEAVGAALAYAFDVHGLYLVEAKYNETNAASGALLAKLGFRRDGVLRGRRIDGCTGERNALVVCSLLADEFKVCYVV